MRNVQSTPDQGVIIVLLTNVETDKDSRLMEHAQVSNVESSRSLEKMELHVKSASHTQDHKITKLDVARMIAQEVSFNSMELACHTMITTIPT